MSLEHDADLVKQLSPTRDAFLGGRLFVAQPARGFRAGLDSVLLGAAVRPHASRLLDLGSGVGTAALVALADRPQMQATLVEADPAMAALAAENVLANGMAERARVLTLDLTGRGAERSAAGLEADHYESVIANPPFFDPRRGSAPVPARAGARHMAAAQLDLWVRAAAGHAAPDGEAIFIYPAAGVPALLAACTGRFGALTLLPLSPREGDAAHRVLLRGIKGSRAPFTLLATRVLHHDGSRDFRAEFDALFRGNGALVW